ncbi:hypothetical protein N9965_01340, partial [bacterium]|nr:hypothetical protein [bacterium]
NAGFVVDPNPDSIAKGLIDAWENRPQLMQMGQAGHDYVTRELTWQSIAEQSVAAYDRIFLK